MSHTPPALRAGMFPRPVACTPTKPYRVGQCIFDERILTSSRGIVPVWQRKLFSKPSSVGPITHNSHSYYANPRSRQFRYSALFPGMTTFDSPEPSGVSGQPSFFEESFMPLGSGYSSFGGIQGPLVDCQSYPNFRALELPNMSAMSDNVELMAMKSESSTLPMICLPPLVTQTNVDLSTWQTLKDTDWNSSFIDDEESSSPSSIGSYDTTLFTPVVEYGSFGDSFVNADYQTNDGLSLMYSAGLSQGKTDTLIPTVCQPNIIQHTDPTVLMQGSGHTDYNSTVDLGGLPMAPMASRTQSDDSFNLTSFCLASETTAIQPLFTRPVDLIDDGDNNNNNNTDNDDDRVSDGDDDDSGISPTMTSKMDRSRLQEIADQAREDDYIVMLRRQGISYAGIKHRGGFTQAVSTLRGRYRNATKHKRDRPRKQLWTPQDVSQVIGSPRCSQIDLIH